jgi:HAD superfamily hydrolase (TIGR01509 family)
VHEQAISTDARSPLPAGIIFDMDDTLVATAPLWRAAEEALLRALGARWSAELALHYKGMNALDVAATIHRRLGTRMPLEECPRRLRTALIAGFESGPLVPMPGAAACVRRMRQVAPLAVASGSPPEAIRVALQALGIAGEFRVVISSEAVVRGKPHPDVFLAAAAALGVAPAQCLVFEDSLIGVRAARAAQMACCAVPSSHGPEIEALAMRVFASLEEVTEDLARACWQR